MTGPGPLAVAGRYFFHHPSLHLGPSELLFYRGLSAAGISCLAAAFQGPSGLGK